jgi:hypothetical protein
MPTEQDAVAALRRVFGEERAAEVWAAACRQAIVPVGTANSAIRLERVAEALANIGAAESAVGRSIAIRLRTYNRLARRSTGGVS